MLNNTEKGTVNNSFRIGGEKINSLQPAQLFINIYLNQMLTNRSIPAFHGSDFTSRCLIFWKSDQHRLYVLQGERFHFSSTVSGARDMTPLKDGTCTISPWKWRFYIFCWVVHINPNVSGNVQTQGKCVIFSEIMMPFVYLSLVLLGESLRVREEVGDKTQTNKTLKHYLLGRHFPLCRIVRFISALVMNSEDNDSHDHPATCVICFVERPFIRNQTTHFGNYTSWNLTSFSDLCVYVVSIRVRIS